MALVMVKGWKRWFLGKSGPSETPGKPHYSSKNVPKIGTLTGGQRGKVKDFNSQAVVVRDGWLLEGEGPAEAILHTDCTSRHTLYERRRNTLALFLLLLQRVSVKEKGG